MNTEAEVDGQCNVDLREKGLSTDEMQLPRVEMQLPRDEM